jgi:6-phosphogluconate dehydrogenase
MNKTFGMIGLGKMGANLCLQAFEKGYTVIGYDLLVNEELKQTNIAQATDIPNMIKVLPPPRIIILLVPAGKAVDTMINKLLPLLSAGDVIVDCGNSYWGDSIRRHQTVSAKEIFFVDCGTSGGIEGARYGACFMLGGDDQAVKLVEPIFKDLSIAGGYVHAGGAGAGHFVKLVHNGIEFGMLQAIGEGMTLLSKYKEERHITNILRCWEHGSVIRSWLIELMRKQLEEKTSFENIPSYVEDTGEVNWLVTDAMNMEVPVPVIAASIMQLIASRGNDNIAAKAIAMMRHGFGGHPFGANLGIQHERMFGQIQGFMKDELKQNKS